MRDGATPDHSLIQILWLTKGLGVGGAERLLVSAARAHDRGRFALRAVYLLRDMDALAGELRAAAVPTQCLDVSSALDPRWLLRLRALLVEEQVDVLHVHSPLVAGFTRLLLRTISRSRRPRLVVTGHASWPSYHLLTRLLNRATVGLDDVHIAVSSRVRAGVPSRHRDSVRTIVHGVAIEELIEYRAHREASRRELGLSESDILVVTVANLVSDKSYPDLLRAARQVIDRSRRVQFVAVGSGPLETDLRRLHESLGLGDRFVFLGFRPDPGHILAAGDVFALASVYEGYPVAVMEAMAIGLPVVATAVGGIPEAVRDGVEGFVRPPRRPDLFADALAVLVLDDDRRRAMAVASAERGRMFDINNTVREIEAMYRDLVRESVLQRDRDQRSRRGGSRRRS